MNVFETQQSSECAIHPLDLTAEAVSRCPESLELARALEANRASLEPIKGYLMRKENISADEAESALKAYLKFLLLVRCTKEQIAPSNDADMFWHAHILHTQIYEPFCKNFFGGHFLHHVPSDPNHHPLIEFLQKQNQLGELFFGQNSIYASHGHCHNSHNCHGSPGETPGQTCAVTSPV